MFGHVATVNDLELDRIAYPHVIFCKHSAFRFKDYSVYLFVHKLHYDNPFGTDFFVDDLFVRIKIEIAVSAERRIGSACPIQPLIRLWKIEGFAGSVGIIYNKFVTFAIFRTSDSRYSGCGGNRKIFGGAVGQGDFQRPGITVVFGRQKFDIVNTYAVFAARKGYLLRFGASAESKHEIRTFVRFVGFENLNVRNIFSVGNKKRYVLHVFRREFYRYLGFGSVIFRNNLGNSVSVIALIAFRAGITAQNA